MAIKNKDVADACELIQDDLMCFLDSLAMRNSKKIIRHVCQIVVDRMKDLDNVLSDNH